jgi:GNAT superfamily N-acetyltransferase
MAPRSAAREVEIRPVTSDDLEAMVDVYLAGARHHAEIDPVAWRVPERADVAARLQRRFDAIGTDHAYVAAVVDGQVVGSATLDADDLPHPGAMARQLRSAELGIAMLEEWRGRGIGRKLIAWLERWAADQGIDRVTLEVSTANDGAIRLYHELGYTDSGIEMRKDLARR